MATHLYEHRVGVPRSRAAWLASLGVHGGMLAALAWLSWTTLGGNRLGPRESADAELGVVVGLTDGASDDSPLETAEGEGLAADGGRAAGMVGESAVRASETGLLPASDAVTSDAPLAPVPRLPLLSLGAGSAPAGEGGVPSAATAAEPGGRPRLGQLVERATVSVFGAVGEGSRFVYVFDHSTSMDGPPLAAAKRQLIGSLESLGSVHQFQVIFFNHELHAWDVTGQGRIPYASEANKQLAAQFVRSVIADGGTERVAPLRRALAMNADVVFFLTDADDPMPAYDTADAIERARSSGTTIACIEFGIGPRPDGENFLTQIAAATGGDYVYVDTAGLGR